MSLEGFMGGSVVKNPPAKAGDAPQGHTWQAWEKAEIEDELVSQSKMINWWGLSVDHHIQWSTVFRNFLYVLSLAPEQPLNIKMVSLYSRSIAK